MWTKRDVIPSFVLRIGDAKREEWAMYHNQKTGGSMGYLPEVKNMPMRITLIVAFD